MRKIVTIENLLNKGDKLMDEDRVEGALFYYQKAYALAPRNVEVLHGMGLALAKSGRLSEALVWYDKALQINPNDPYIWNNKGRVQTDKGEYEQAVKCFRQSLKLDRKFTWPWNNLGVTMEELGRYKEAFQFYNHAVRLDPEYDVAVENLQRLLKRFPEVVGKKPGKRIPKQLPDNKVKKKVVPATLEEQMKQTRAELKVGDVLVGRYKIRKVISKGGMGSVYIAYDKKTWKKLVALKSFKEADSWDKETRESLKREAYTWVNLGRHPNIVEAKDVEEIHGKIYIVMEYVDGGDLGEWIRKGRLGVLQSLDVGIQFCNGMEYASEAMKMVHRDIKPGNMLITKDGTLKVTDFGEATSSHHEEFGGLTLPYAAPEQFLEQMGENVNIDTRSDIYSFGVVLYEMLTGRRPFESIETYKKAEQIKGRVSQQELEQFISESSRSELVQKHLNEIPIPPVRLNQRIPKKLDYLVSRCLAKHQNHRYRDFRSLKAELMKRYKELSGVDYTLPEPIEESGAWYWINKGHALQNLKQYEKAIRCYDKAFEINPQREFAWSDKGVALYNLKRYGEAIRCYDKAVEINPQDDFAWNNKGNALRDLKQYEEAIRCYDKSLELNPQNEVAWLNKATALGDLKRYAESIVCYDSVLEIDPLKENAWNNKGNILRKLKRYQEAITCYDRALELNPQFHSPWYNKGTAFQNLKRYQEAIACYDKSLEIDPLKENAWHNKGNILWDLETF